MNTLLPPLAVVGCLVAVLGAFGLLARHVRRRGTAGAAITAAMASYDEAFRVTAYEAHQEIQARAGWRAPLPSPDGPGRAVRADPPPDRPYGRRPRPRTRRSVLRRWARRARG
ncbi:hypothetical protein OG875_08785 [Streptomyces sp. NBC_01498]|uniref:hypothetical protein n=1 Tax=Streptomyces sp. NBC_01498 TaxID=2975870 RepID=UPI002E7AAFE9|nr:hypothetical protein [Streptomyces sp. NBC_01498]WTL24687.1 hypothetical protein OG875_08785 [Streptomyces sp. NBC_01498]